MSKCSLHSETHLVDTSQGKKSNSITPDPLKRRQLLQKLLHDYSSSSYVIQQCCVLPVM